MESTSRRSVLTLLAGALALGACGKSGGDAGGVPSPAPVASSPRAVAATPLNVVLIVIDTLRADAVFDPAEKYDTPNLDRLAREGIAFEHTFSAAPMTLPSHMSLFSSRPVGETKVFNNGQSVPADVPLLAEWLASHGYDTRAVLSLGSLGVLDPDQSPARGFQSYDSNYWNISPAEKTMERLRASLAARDAAKPLFLFAHFSEPHEPYESHGTEEHPVLVRMDGELLVQLESADMQQWKQTVELTSGRTVFEFVTEEHKQRFNVRAFDCMEGGRPLPVQWEVGAPLTGVTNARAAIDRGERPSAPCDLRIWVNDIPANDDVRRERYALEVNYADRYVGELLAELERLGLYQDSLVLFTSDHGEGLGEHKGFGHVENLSDGLIHVPLIVKLPRGDPHRAELERAAKRMVSHIDLVPTLLELAALPPLPGQRGTSLLAPHEAVLLPHESVMSPHESVMSPHESVHVAQTSRPEAKKNQLAFRDERFKMVYFPDEERFELYDLGADPDEFHDVFAERKGERASWPEQLRELYRQSQEHRGVEGAVDQEERLQMLRALGYAEGK